MMHCRRAGVDVEEQVRRGTPLLKHKEGGVGCRGREAKLSKIGGEPLVPCARSLLETIERSLQETHMVRMSRVNKAWRLLTVDGLLQVSVKKSVLHVQLVDRPAPGSGDAEDDADRRWLDDGAERLIVVDAVALSEAANNPASLVTGKGTIGVEFMLINPLACHNIGARGLGDDPPSVVVDECLVLLSHSRPPLQVCECSPVVPRDWGDGSGGEGHLSRRSRRRWWWREDVVLNRPQGACLRPRHRPAD